MNESKELDTSSTTSVIPTGLRDLDEILGGGMHKGDLVLIGSRPAVGKTALAMRRNRHATIQMVSII